MDSDLKVKKQTLTSQGVVQTCRKNMRRALLIPIKVAQTNLPRFYSVLIKFVRNKRAQTPDN